MVAEENPQTVFLDVLVASRAWVGPETVTQIVTGDPEIAT